MEIFQELKNLIGLKTDDYDFIVVTVSLMIIVYMLKMLWSVILSAFGKC